MSNKQTYSNSIIVVSYVKLNFILFEKLSFYTQFKVSQTFTFDRNGRIAQLIKNSNVLYQKLNDVTFYEILFFHLKVKSSHSLRGMRS